MTSSESNSGHTPHPALHAQPTALGPAFLQLKAINGERQLHFSLLF